MMKKQPAHSAWLVLNPGSSSIKWSLHALEPRQHSENTAPLHYGQCKGNTQDSAAAVLLEATTHCDDYAAVIRFVHGGSDYFEPLQVDDANLATLKELVPLAPLHNAIAIELITQLRHRPNPPTVIAVFDTAFFKNLPMAAQSYGLPKSLTEKYGIRRYGFHGFAHQAMVDHWLTMNPARQHSKLVTAQLGSGCSMAAIQDGRPIDTTMGFTPNEGLLMRTRSGDLDPGLLLWLQGQEAWSPEDADHVLNHQSGWMGVSGGIDNMGQLFNRDDGPSRRAFELFCHRFRKTLGSYYAILGGLDAVILSGGIAENSSEICRHLLGGLSHMGIHLAAPVDDRGLDDIALTSSLRENNSDDGNSLPLRLSDRASPVQCWSVYADEANAMLQSVQARFQSVTQ